MLIGYARVSTTDQHLTIQREALKAAGCKRIYEEKASGAERDRSQLKKLLDDLREEDIVVVTRLDRLARSTQDLLAITEIIKKAEAGLRSLGEHWADTETSTGKMMLTVFAGIAEFERSLIMERTEAGKIEARKNGVRFGRPPKLNSEKIALGKRLVKEGKSIRQAARLLNCHHATLYRAIKN